MGGGEAVKPTWWQKKKRKSKTSHHDEQNSGVAVNRNLLLVLEVLKTQKEGFSMA